MSEYAPNVTIGYWCQYCGTEIRVRYADGWPAYVLHYEWNGDVSVARPAWFFSREDHVGPTVASTTPRQVPEKAARPRDTMDEITAPFARRLARGFALLSGFPC